MQCDLEAPECARCVKANRKCEGYNRGHVFVNYNSRDNPLKGTGDKLTRQALQQSREKLYSPRQSQILVHPQKLRATYSLPKHINDVPSLRCQFLSHLMGVYLPETHSINSTPERRAVSFLYDTPGLLNNEPVVDVAFDAFCVVTLCRVKEDANLAKFHLHLHAQALLELRRAIADHKRRNPAAILAAISFLSLYQVSKSQLQGYAALYTKCYYSFSKVQLHGRVM